MLGRTANSDRRRIGYVNPTGNLLTAGLAAVQRDGAAAVAMTSRPFLKGPQQIRDDMSVSADLHDILRFGSDGVHTSTVARPDQPRNASSRVPHPKGGIDMERAAGLIPAVR